jgi:hypothetical protein
MYFAPAGTKLEIAKLKYEAVGIFVRPRTLRLLRLSSRLAGSPLFEDAVAPDAPWRDRCHGV